MGWTSFDVHELTMNKKGEYDRKAYLDKEYTCENTMYIWECLKSTMIGSTWYGAVKRTNKSTGEVIVYGAVTLTSIDKGEFYYKDMSESMGPGYYDCPESILKLLTPTDNEFANNWREKCKERIKEKTLRTKFFKMAKDSKQVKYIKMILPKNYNESYKKGDIIYLMYGRYYLHGKIGNYWRDENFMHWSSRNIDIHSCTLITQDGDELIMDEKGNFNKIVTF